MNLRNIYLGFSGFMAIMGLILAFENIMIQANGMMIFFDTVTGSLFLPLLLVLCVGFGSGFFFGLFVKTDKKKGPNLDYGSDVDI